MQPGALGRGNDPLSLQTRSRGWVCALAALTGLLWQVSCYAANTITRVEAVQVGREVGIAVTAAGDRITQLDAFTLDHPPRLVFDLPETILAPDLAGPMALAGPALRQVRVGQFQAEPPVVRLVVDLAESGGAPPYRVAQGAEPGQTLVLFRTGVPPMLRMPSLQTQADATVLRFPGIGALSRQIGVLNDPPRVYVDVTDAELESGQRQAFVEGPITEIRMAKQTQRDGHPVARLVVEMREDLAHSIFGEGDDLVVALGREPWALPLPEYRGAGRLRGKLVVVDPGHGGTKPGALGVDAKSGEVCCEKDITLDLGLRLERLLAAEGAQVLMTRNADTDVGLRQRADLANQAKADVFVSLHCNSCNDPNTLDGTMVFFDHPDSVRLAQLTHDELIGALGTADKGVRNANFAVIRRTRMPGILVEVAFINHEGDRERLLNVGFRERAARAILQGVIRFFDSQANGAPPA
jgi:N-acetylmuramoyl-L-alanine amidase